MNAEHGEENIQVKAHAYVHRWMDRIWVKEFGVVRVFLATRKNNNKKSKKVTKTN